MRYKSLVIALGLLGTEVQAESLIGKFQIVQLGELRRDQFLLDTEVGNLWRLVVDKEGRGVWQREDFDCITKQGETYVRGFMPSPYATALCIPK